MNGPSPTAPSRTTNGPETPAGTSMRRVLAEAPRVSEPKTWLTSMPGTTKPARRVWSDIVTSGNTGPEVMISSVLDSSVTVPRPPSQPATRAQTVPTMISTRRREASRPSISACRTVTSEAGSTVTVLPSRKVMSARPSGPVTTRSPTARSEPLASAAGRPSPAPVRSTGALSTVRVAAGARSSARARAGARTSAGSISVTAASTCRRRGNCSGSSRPAPTAAAEPRGGKA